METAKNIKITEACTEEVAAKLETSISFENIINKIDILKYVSELSVLFIIFQCFPKDIQSRVVKEYKIHRRKTQALELYLVLDYDKIMAGTDAENLEHIKDVFLKGSETFLKPLKGFNYDGFMEEVKNLIFIK